MIFKAVIFATRAHSGQFRKGTRIPYIIHPLNVCKILTEAGCDEKTIIAGILHDTFEDTPVNMADINDYFGADIAQIVYNCSESDKSLPWKERKLQSITHLQSMPVEVLMVAIADKTDNLGCIRHDMKLYGESVWERFNAGKDMQHWYYTELLNVFEKFNDINPELFNMYVEEYNKVFNNGMK